MKKNINYQTEELKRYFSDNRIKWSQLYCSERKLINSLELKESNSVLDIGCGCGGLGLILDKKFHLKDYVGVEINEEQAILAKERIGSSKIFHSDILKVKEIKRKFDFVFSLSCIDWNVEFDNMLERSLTYVKPGGSLILTLRLTNQESLVNMEDSFQYINYDNEKKGEKAPYIVLNYNELFVKLLSKNNIKKIHGYGYWKEKAKTAVCKYDELYYVAICIKTSASSNKSKILNISDL